MSLERWLDVENARQYDEFARTYPMYRRTSADLVRRAALAGEERVLDLACGTGITTEEILRQLGPNGRVVAYDSSPAMQGRGRRRIDDARVDWVIGRADELLDRLTGTFDAVICNSAIWQLDPHRSVPAIAALLGPVGCFVCNLGDQTSSGGGRSDAKPGLSELMRAYAVIDHDFVFRPGLNKGRRVQLEEVEAALHDCGLRTSRERVAYERDPDELYAWMQVPVFTEHLTGLSYPERMSALHKAWARFDKSQIRRQRWVILTARH